MKVPNELKYAKVHAWIRVKGATATVDSTDFAQSEVGDVVYRDIEVAPQNAIFDSVESVQTVLYKPVTGEAMAVNTQMSDETALVNADP